MQKDQEFKVIFNCIEHSRTGWAVWDNVSKKKKRANIVNANHAINCPLVLLVSEDYSIPDSSLVKLREMTEALQLPRKAGLLRHLTVAYVSCHGTNFTRHTITSRPMWKSASQRDLLIATTVDFSCHSSQMFVLEVFVCAWGWVKRRTSPNTA